MSSEPGAKKLKGTIKFKLKGATGGTWCLALPDFKGTKSDGPAQLTIESTAQDFLNFMNGRTTRRQLKAEGRPFVWDGSRELLRDFLAILQPHRAYPRG